MRNRSNEFLINAVYQKVRVLFWFSILLFAFLSLVNYVDLSAPIFGKPITFTVRGEVSLVDDDPKAHKIETNSKDDVHNEIQKIVLKRNGAFVRLNYKNIFDGFTLRNITITLLSLLGWWIWTVFLYQLMKLLRSFKAKSFFEATNIRRLRVMGIVFFVSPVLIQAKDILFSSLVANQIDFLGMYVGVPNGFWIFPSIISLKVIFGFAIMLFILILAQVFAYGFTLKKENDLTV